MGTTMVLSTEFTSQSQVALLEQFMNTAKPENPPRALELCRNIDACAIGSINLPLPISTTRVWISDLRRKEFKEATGGALAACRDEGRGAIGKDGMGD